jgi:two-component system sensor histidine kinase UhpB
LPADWSRAGHYGLRGLKDRVEQLGGNFSVGAGDERGVRLLADIPLGSQQ